MDARGPLYLKGLMYHEQMESTEGSQGWFNIQKSSDAIYRSRGTLTESLKFVLAILHPLDFEYF